MKKQVTVTVSFDSKPGSLYHSMATVSLPVKWNSGSPEVTWEKKEDDLTQIHPYYWTKFRTYTTCQTDRGSIVTSSCWKDSTLKKGMK